MKTIPLTQGYFTKVDNEDYEKFASIRWHAAFGADSKPRACRKTDLNGKKVTQHLSRVITEAKKGTNVDHINHDTLDNRKSNLRFCNPSENQANMIKPKNNTSGYKGVCWNKMAHKWQVNICKDCKRYYFGLHKSKKKAARVYDDAAIKMFGEFAKLNFPKRKSPDN